MKNYHRVCWSGWWPKYIIWSAKNVHFFAESLSSGLVGGEGGLEVDQVVVEVGAVYDGVVKESYANTGRQALEDAVHQPAIGRRSVGHAETQFLLLELAEGGGEGRLGPIFRAQWNAVKSSLHVQGREDG